MNSSGYELFAELSRALWWFIALSLAYGLIIMAFLQFLKDAYLRRSFHRREFHRHFPDAAVHKQLVELATGGDENALYDLPIKRLAWQLRGTLLSTPSASSEGQAGAALPAAPFLNAFQIATASRWKRLFHRWSLVIGFLIGFAPFLVWGDTIDIRIMVVGLAAAVFGGLLAPILRDIAASFTRND